MPERKSVQVLDRQNVATPATDLVLYHNGMDVTWSRKLSERIRGERSGNRHLSALLASWNFSRGTDVLAEAEKCLRNSRFFGVVITAPMLREDWPELEKLISVLSDLGLANGRIVAILKENVTKPPLLRLQEWIDFRDGNLFEESSRDLVALLS